MDIDYDMNEISLHDEDIEAVPEIIVSVMSMMRKKWEYNITASAMELDEDATMELKKEHEEDEASNSSDEEEKEADVQRSESDLNEEKPLRDLTEKKDDASNARRVYTQQDINKLIALLVEQVPIKDAALRTGINEKSAYRFKSQWQKTGEVPQQKKRGRRMGTVSELTEKHSKFIIDLVDEHSTTTVAGIHELLLIEFPSLSVSPSAVYRHLRTSCALSMKKLEKISVARNSEETLKKRKETILQWLADKEMDFENNCVFLDEAGFNLHMTRTRGWSKKGAPAKTTVPASKGTTITILGAISSAGIIDISLRKPIMVSGAKKRRVDGKVVTTTAKVGTRAEHYLNYLSNVMDVLDRNNMKGFYLVMDNAPIHKPATIRNLIESRGYKCVYLPPYSPFLNPIELFWSKVKYGVKRKPFETGETLTPRIMDACSKVTKKDCQGWIHHSLGFFEKCLALEKNL